MATYNGERYLEESIDSILSQTFQNFEFIIVDDASTDDTPRILKRYRNHPKIRLLRNKNNLGLPASLNRAIDLACGHWIARQDDDDISYPNRLELQYNYILKNPEIVLLGTRAEFVDEELRTFAYWDVPESHKDILKKIKWENPFCHSTVIFNKRAIKDIGKYRDKFKYSEDLDLWLRVIEKFNTHNLPEYLGKVRRHKHSTSVSHLNEQLAQHVLAYVYYKQRKTTGSDRYNEMPESKFCAYLKKTYPEHVPFFEELRNKKYISFLYEAKESHDWEKGLFFSLELAKLHPTDSLWLREMSFFLKKYAQSSLEKHLLWRINKIKAQ
ncbi:glycosyltransferase EpsE epsE [Methylomarinovum tepidoasis]|uniref:Glycosyltransferase EpsE epsE n=1 Tax=Methylomarinovum tepidoasis TaxID=2840183 RepID=A0AAU9C0C4_9GAMM|nr:glycosyltransferase [Methylomarinovum sp. IN45]BCX89353.1 glycosyltransferase EpsE epsE [Methylomarinovum sp. IN45]